MGLTTSLIFLFSSVATFGLERASCKVDEAVTLTVCVVLRGMKRDCPVEFPFDLRLEARGKEGRTLV